jgi:hypothetical protein
MTKMTQIFSITKILEIIPAITKKILNIQPSMRYVFEGF